MKNFPNKLYFLSDDTEATFERELKGTDKNKLTERTAEYRWHENTIGKGGKCFPMTLTRIEYFISVKRLQEHEPTKISFQNKDN